MELNVNSPTYFKEKHGVDDAVCRYCQRLYVCFKEKNYGEKLMTIGIVPVAAPKEEYESGKWKESINIISGGEVASIMIRMDYEGYCMADERERIILTQKMIEEAVMRIRKRSKMDWKRFFKDLEDVTNGFLEEI